MPINTDLSLAPYYDDFDPEKQYHRILFKPGYAVQARELTQLQSILQNQLERFGENIFQEGSIVKGCNFTQLPDLKFVRVNDKLNFDVANFVGGTTLIDDGLGNQIEADIFYELEGTVTGLRAAIITSTRGFETRFPDLNTFYINYLNTGAGEIKVFAAGELLNIRKLTVVGNDVIESVLLSTTINVSERNGHVGDSYGVKSSEGIIFQKGHFALAKEQIAIVSKYTNVPDQISVGYLLEETLISAQDDETLYDNANGSPNQNAAGADRLRLVPVLTALPFADAEANDSFFSLIRYSGGQPVQLRDVSQYNVIGEEMAKRTFEESGNYIVDSFDVNVITRDGVPNVSIKPGIAYVRGYRVESRAEFFVPLEPMKDTEVGIQSNQTIGFSYGGYLTTTSIDGQVDLNTFSSVDLLSANSEIIGTTRVSNITNDRIFIFDTKMNAGKKFSDVEKLIDTTGEISIVPALRQTASDVLLFDTGMFNLKSIQDMTIPVRDQRIFTSVLSDTIIITADIGEDYAVDNLDLVIVDSTNTRLNVQSTSLSGGNTVLTINLVPGQSPSSPGVIYVNKNIVNAEPHQKISKTVYIKSIFDANNVVQKYNLGFPDVYKIEEILDSANNDVTGSFKLVKNQKGNFYDHSYLELISGRTVPADGLMTVKLKVFQVSTTTGKYFFTVDSYQTDVPTEEIPTFISANGKVYNLRNCIDFRPHVTALGDYNAAFATSAPTIPTPVNIAPVFPAGQYLTPANGEFAKVDYEYYLARYDLVAVDSYGKFSIVRGNAATKPVPPRIDANRLVIAEIFIPGLPAYASDVPSIENRQDYFIKIKPRGVKNYTMQDIKEIDDKIERLIYYTTLSQLEADTKNLNITDENGLTRFKNGILVDPFNDLSIANVNDSEFSAGLDFTEKSLIPSVKAFPLNLKYSSNSAATVYPSLERPDIATIESVQDLSLISQKFATSFRNCVSNFYSYEGTGFLSPEYDGSHDVVNNPPQTIVIDTVTPLVDFVDSLQRMIPLTQTNTQVVSNNRTRNVVTTGNTRSGGTVTTTTTTTTQLRDTTTALQVSAKSTVNKQVGDFVTNLEFNPYMRSRPIQILMFGLRPNTRHYIFFDEKDVNEFTSPATITDDVRTIRRNGQPGAPLISNSNGVIAAIFVIPPETFFVGDRKIQIADVDQFASIESGGTSGGFLTYRAYNFSIEKQKLITSTRAPDTTIQTSTTNRTVVTRDVSVRRIPPQQDSDRDRNPGRDPIAQTFFIKSSMGNGSDTVFVSKLDLYFKRKSDINGVSVMIREVINGYPGPSILPFSLVHFNPTEINTSEDASIPTEVIFKAPVRLDVEKEYCFVVQPDANDPDYLIYISKVGGVDLGPSAVSVTQDWGDGILFTSTNNRAWQSVQDEDIKFTLYRKQFLTADDSTIILENDNHEFLSIENVIGKFQNGEEVYSKKPILGATSASLTLTEGSFSMSGTNLTDTYSIGDSILIENGTNRDIATVTNITATVLTSDSPALLSGSVTVFPVVKGILSYYDFRDPFEMVLESSTATALRKFTAGDLIEGVLTNAQATVTTVDDIEMSYLQPMINRTTDTVSNITLTGRFVDPDDTNVTYDTTMSFSDKHVFNEKATIVFSRSNDLTGAKNMKFVLSLTNSGSSTSTPFLDIETAFVFANQYQITNNPVNTSRYISRTIELAEDLDAEDFNVFVTGYKPFGTDIRVYIRVQNASDSSNFDSNDWIELEKTAGANIFSSKSNLNDFREFEYGIPVANKDNGVVTYTNDNGIFDGFRKFAIKIELLADNIGNVPRLLDYRGIALT